MLGRTLAHSAVNQSVANCINEGELGRGASFGAAPVDHLPVFGQTVVRRKGERRLGLWRPPEKWLSTRSSGRRRCYLNILSSAPKRRHHHIIWDRTYPDAQSCDTKSSFISALRQGTPPPRSVPCLNNSMPFPECSSDGRCACKDNVEGAGCDRCAEGTYGLGQDEHAVLNS